jgi:hypothetical protein
MEILVGREGVTLTYEDETAQSSVPARKAV